MDTLLTSTEVLTIFNIEPPKKETKFKVIRTSTKGSTNKFAVTCPSCTKIFIRLSSLVIHLNSYHRNEFSVKLPQFTDEITSERLSRVREQNRIRVQRYRKRVKTFGKEIGHSKARLSLRSWSEEEKLERRRELARRRIQKYRSLRSKFVKIKVTTNDESQMTIEGKLREIERLRELSRVRVQRHRARVSAEAEKEAILIEIGLIQPKDFKYTEQKVKEEKELVSKHLQICIICGKTFKTSHSLKFHEIIHQVERFECELCGKFFLQPELEIHLQDFHAKEQIYSCAICGNQYKYKSSLRAHVKSHENQKVFEPAEFFSTFQSVGSTVDFSCLGLDLI